jgi:Protein of unknown function, DUF547
VIPQPHRRPLFWRIYYRLNGIRGDEILNHGGQPSLVSEPLDRVLRRCMNTLQTEVIDPEGMHVDYVRLETSTTFITYLSLVAGLRTFDLRSLSSRAERMAFWLNLYNALIIHAVIARHIPRFVNKEGGIFDWSAYCVNGYRFSANDIEHGILRSNRGHPLVPGPVFAADDPRREFVLEQLDPRLHAALNCAARSCPPINFYDSDRLESQLDIAMRNFVNGGAVALDRSGFQVSLSRIFSWYASDFGGQWFGFRHPERLIQYVLPYLHSNDDQEWLEANHSKLKVRFLPYNWSLNV